MLKPSQPPGHVDIVECGICGVEFDFISDTGHGIPISTETALIVPNSYIGEWGSVECCKKCFDKHNLWSVHFMYFEYMLRDGRLELTPEELVNYGHENAANRQTMEISPSGTVEAATPSRDHRPESSAG